MVRCHNFSPGIERSNLPITEISYSIVKAVRLSH